MINGYSRSLTVSVDEVLGGKDKWFIFGDNGEKESSFMITNR